MIFSGCCCLISFIKNLHAKDTEKKVYNHKNWKEFKEFQKIKILSKFIPKVKSNNIRDLKIDYIIYKQQEKEKFDKMLNKCMKEENKILRNNLIESKDVYDQNDFTIEI